MGKAWSSGSKKPLYQRTIIYRYLDGDVFRYETKNDQGVVRQVARSFAEHEVCSGAARYVEGRA